MELPLLLRPQHLGPQSSRIEGFAFRVHSFVCRVCDLGGYRVQGSGNMVQGLRDHCLRSCGT